MQQDSFVFDETYGVNSWMVAVKLSYRTAWSLHIKISQCSIIIGQIFITMVVIINIATYSDWQWQNSDLAVVCAKS